MIAIPDRPEDPRPEERAGGLPEEEGPADPGGPAEPPHHSTAEVQEAIASEILRIHEESYGSGAQDVRTLILEDWVVVVLDGVELAANEKFLVDHGKRDAVAHVRSQYQHAIQDSFRAAIERATGRKVIGFSSSTSVEEPRFMVEAFKLG